MSASDRQGAFGNTADVANDAAFADNFLPLTTVDKLGLDHGSGSDDAGNGLR